MILEAVVRRRKLAAVLTGAVLLLANLGPLQVEAATINIPVGTNPVGVAVNPETRRVYVANRGSNTISVIDAVTDRLIATIPEGGVPNSIAVNPRTNRVYVTNLTRTVSVIDGASNLVIATIGVGLGPFALDVNAETDRIYVANRYDHNVSVIDGSTNSVIATIDVGGSPSGVAVNPLTNLVYVANNELGNIAVISGSSNQIVGTIATAAPPSDVAVNAETDRLYVTTSPTVTVLDGTSHEVIASIELIGASVNVAVNANLDLVYVLGIGFNRVTIVDARTNIAVGFVELGGFSGEFDVDPASNKLYVSQYFSNAVAAIALGDLSAPVIAPSMSPAPNANGWNNGSVSVTWTVSDADSGIMASSGCAAATFSAPTEGTTVTCTATNGGGLSYSRSVIVKIDTTAPTISADARTVEGLRYFAGTWSRQTVTVRYACFDLRLPTVASSGLASCPDAQTFDQDGTLVASGTAADNAGNTSTALFGLVRIDRSPPTINASATTADGSSYRAGEWANQAVTVHYSCADALSGVLSCAGDQQFSHETSVDGTVGAASASDNARNTATATFGPIRIDLTYPTISASSTTADGNPYTFGSWTNQAVTVDYSCTDALSGIAVCSDDQRFDEEGSFVGFHGSATDNAQNGVIRLIGAVQIDRTAPSITFSGNAGTYEVDQTVAITCSASDSASGIVETTCPAVADALAADYVATSTSVTLSATATDAAANTTTAATSFSVNVTSDGVCRLAAGARTADAICARAQSIANATNAQAKAAQQDAFDTFLAAPNDLSEAQAAVLSRLARLL